MTNSSITRHTKQLAFDLGLRRCCADFNRFSRGASSSSKVRRTNFIQGLPDACKVFGKEVTKFDKQTHGTDRPCYYVMAHSRL